MSLIVTTEPAHIEPAVQTLPLAQSRHIPALDGIRGIAVLLILFCHATIHPFGEAGVGLDSTSDKLILVAARFCWSGVDLFFVLSGFLITGILLDAKGKDHYFRNFYARRTVRIFPLYYVSLIIFLLIWPRLGPTLNAGFGELKVSQAWYWLYQSNYIQFWQEQKGQSVDHIMAVTWSLSIEEQFYLCWPLVVFLCSRKTLWRVLIGMLIGSMALRTILMLNGQMNLAMGITPCRMDGLTVGAIIAMFSRQPDGMRRLLKPAYFLLPISIGGLVTLIYAMGKLGYHQGIGQSPGFSVCGTDLMAMMYGSLLIIAGVSMAGTWTNHFFAHPILRTFGKYSYAIYLFHMPVIQLVSNHLFHPSRIIWHNSHLPGLIVFYAITWTLSLAAAIVSWNVLEKYFLRLKNYFPLETK